MLYFTIPKESTLTMSHSQMNPLDLLQSSSMSPVIILYLLILSLNPSPIFGARNPSTNTTTTCHDTCGTLPIKFPFGTGPGCGHPEFSKHISCSTTTGTLQFTTATGSILTVSSIDYPSNTLIVTDPLMSNCSFMQNSGSFTLDGSGPFKPDNNNIFVLLGCSTNSPIYDRKEDICDTGSGLRVCRGLYSCKGVGGIGLGQNGPVSTCCVYDPRIVLASDRGFELDLPKLQCSSYTSIYGFGGSEGDPMKWEFGVSLKYNESNYRAPQVCRNCEESGGLCGFSENDEAFACICHNGVNTTNNCYGRGYSWSGTRITTVQTAMSFGGCAFWISVSWIILFT